MIKKEVKAYGKTQRQRIEFNKGDHLEVGQEVIILTNQEYDELLECQSELQKVKNELIAMQNQEVNLKELIQDVTAPIYENHKKELQNKDKQINQLQDKLDALKKIFNQFIISITSLSAWDIFFRGKHKDLISDFNSRIWITTKDNEVEDMDQPAIPGDEGKK